MEETSSGFLYAVHGRSPYTGRAILKFGISKENPNSRLARHASAGLPTVLFVIEHADYAEVEKKLRQSMPSAWRPESREFPSGHAESILIHRESAAGFASALRQLIDPLPEQAENGLAELVTHAERLDAAARGVELYRSLMQLRCRLVEQQLAGQAVDPEILTELLHMIEVFEAQPASPVVKVEVPVDVEDSPVVAMLKEYRDRVREERGLHPLGVFPDCVIERIAEDMPTTLEELSRVKGFGPSMLDKFGEDLLDILQPLSFRQDAFGVQD